VICLFCAQATAARADSLLLLHGLFVSPEKKTNNWHQYCFMIMRINNHVWIYDHFYSEPSGGELNDQKQ